MAGIKLFTSPGVAKKAPAMSSLSHLRKLRCKEARVPRRRSLTVGPEFDRKESHSRTFSVKAGTWKEGWMENQQTGRAAYTRVEVENLTWPPKHIAGFDLPNQNSIL